MPDNIQLASNLIIANQLAEIERLKAEVATLKTNLLYYACHRATCPTANPEISFDLSVRKAREICNCGYYKAIE